MARRARITASAQTTTADSDAAAAVARADPAEGAALAEAVAVAEEAVAEVVVEEAAEAAEQTPTAGADPSTDSSRLSAIAGEARDLRDGLALTDQIKLEHNSCL